MSIPLLEKESLTDNVILSGQPNIDSNYIIKHVFNLHDPITLSKMEIEIVFLPITEKVTLELSQKHQKLDPVIRQLKSWHKYKTKLLKADIRKHNPS